MGKKDWLPMQLRITKHTLNILDKLVVDTDLNRSEVMRELIEFAGQRIYGIEKKTLVAKLLEEKHVT